MRWINRYATITMLKAVNHAIYNRPRVSLEDRARNAFVGLKSGLITLSVFAAISVASEWPVAFFSALFIIPVSVFAMKEALRKVIEHAS